MSKTYIKDYTNSFLIHGQEYTVTAPARFDASSNQLIPDNQLDDIAVELANKQYRQQFKLVTPEEIKTYRAQVGLTQRELAELLGWSPNTIALYETGAFPTKANNKLLKALMMHPKFLMAFVNQDSETHAMEINEKVSQYLHIKH
ncbi:type II TA system antitoxin MqsA family protein [Lactiplantibacillus daoliensis]|uniref:Type II TA system antitoxin MqsA family protein n=1 Tax=Lactiplantibacillus daoliensis TaxID=2559916 RepID=A0ABW1UI95_9LACO|nr:type II TA system antitoxin MqsA family protein [Lactiplantibacillus daoliensis]